MRQEQPSCATKSKIYWCYRDKNEKEQKKHAQSKLNLNKKRLLFLTGSCKGRSQMPQSKCRGNPAGTAAAAAARADGLA
jgi:hypothetical protein